MFVTFQFLKHEGNTDVWTEVWSAWCWFHLGDYTQAMEGYQRVQTREKLDERIADNVTTDIAVCCFYLGMAYYLYIGRW